MAASAAVSATTRADMRSTAARSASDSLTRAAFGTSTTATAIGRNSTILPTVATAA